MVTQGSTLSPWFSVISDAGAHWHLVPVEFGYRPVIGVPARVKVEGRLLRVEVQGQDYSPSTTGWFGFRRGVFSPADPPGPTPPCGTKDLGGLPASNGEGEVPPAHYACHDGWALLTGTFEMSPYIELMNWQGSSGWTVISTGAQLADAPMWYGLPLPRLWPGTRRLPSKGTGWSCRSSPTAAWCTSTARTGWLWPSRLQLPRKRA
jgi:hypothetical protein